MITFLILTFLITSIFATTVGGVIYVVSEDKLSHLIQKQFKKVLTVADKNDIMFIEGKK